MKPILQSRKNLRGSTNQDFPLETSFRDGRGTIRDMLAGQKEFVPISSVFGTHPRTVEIDICPAGPLFASSWISLCNTTTHVGGIGRRSRVANAGSISRRSSGTSSKRFSQDRSARVFARGHQLLVTHLVTPAKCRGCRTHVQKSTWLFQPSFASWPMIYDFIKG